MYRECVLVLTFPCFFISPFFVWCSFLFFQDVRVIAWGLSLERPTMIKYGITNIRELFGHKADLNRTKTAPVCRFD